MLEFENAARAEGFLYIAGIDEAGRGPLAGPVVAAAVILPLDVALEGVTDSKKLSPLKRAKLFDLIMKNALAVGVGMADAAMIDRINILQATLRAMEMAVAELLLKPDLLLIDGISKTALTVEQRMIKKGDSLSLSIAAASIIAKVTRDRMMEQYEEEYPGYGFSGHKGYGSKAHMEAIARLGPSPIHRRTFGGVKEYVNREV